MLAENVIEGEDRGTYSFDWHYAWNRPNKTKLGTTGWATIRSSTNDRYKAGTTYRVHLCAHTPCQAMWPASKYTEFGPPLHLQLIPTLSQQSLMEASSKASSEDSKATFDEILIDHHQSNYYSDAISLLNGLPPLWPSCSQQRLP